MEVSAGDTVTLDVEYADNGGAPLPRNSFWWKKDGAVIQRNEHFDDTPSRRRGNPRLTVTKAVGADAGLYTLEAVTAGGKGAVNVTLIVYGETKIMRSLGFRRFFIYSIDINLDIFHFSIFYFQFLRWFPNSLIVVSFQEFLSFSIGFHCISFCVL